MAKHWEVKRDGSVVQIELACFRNKVVSNAQTAVVGTHAPAVRKGVSGDADWVIILIHALREYIDRQYRRLKEILFEIRVSPVYFGYNNRTYPISRFSPARNRTSK